MTIVSCQSGQRFWAAAHLAGRQVACPSCAAPLLIPSESKIPVVCGCGGRFQANASLAGKVVKCPSCQQDLHVPTPAVDLSMFSPESTFDPLAQSTFAATLPAPRRVVQPSSTSSADLNRWVIASIVGGAAFVLLFIGGYSAWTWISAAVEEVRAVTEGTNNGEAKARQEVEAELARSRSASEPATPEEMESYYRLPAGTEDTTKLWASASSDFYTDAFRTDAAGIQVVDTSKGFDIPPPGHPWQELARAKQLLQKYRHQLDQLHQAA